MSYISDYALLAELNIQGLGLCLLDLPTEPGVIRMSGEPNIADLTIMLDRVYKGSTVPPMHSECPKEDQCAIGLTLIKYLHGDYPETSDPWAAKLITVLPFIKTLDYGASLDFLVDFVEWYGAMELMSFKGIADQSNIFSIRAESLMSTLRFAAAGIIVQPAPDSQVRSYNDWLSGIDSSYMPILCYSGLWCSKHTNLYQLPPGKKFAPGDDVCASPLTLPTPNNEYDAHLLLSSLDSFRNFVS